ncbi:hypothetical protein Focb16_v005433 [Fusarium oxysporum f. sp. cubense]|uniref:Uncharacterized protein n=1 Tax=Fusarium oxysporum f. sp. cubense TaxID=61366 RepID=A0A559LKP4_FUSOC|nr:hypothetical protein Focb16_v005433 [Fusarium oxysporum f. sp. cubense]
MEVSFLGARPRDEIKSDYTASISVGGTKLSEIISNFVSKTWSNLPKPPSTQRTFLFVWFLIADEYDVNHNTINWDSSTVNTFVHVWPIMDRIKVELEKMHLYWVVGTRNCTDYYESTGPIDEKIFYPEYEPIPQIAMIEDELFPAVFEDSKSEFCSSSDFRVSSMNPSEQDLVNISEMFVERQMDEITGSPA